ncbi:MAG: ATP-binding cassette domain-containing protein, partial [Christensenellales bacterium]|nr:ATP-binding cassette domain-containing protein [Christensenellales bacterium]
MENNVVLTMRGITMTFPGVKALDHVDFTLRKGEIHALMGENGAGKSTLIKCLTGVNDFEAGEIRVEGIEGPVRNHSTLEAQKRGIS